MYISWDPAILLLCPHPGEVLTYIHKRFSKNVFNSIIEYSSAGEEIIQYSYDGILCVDEN